MNYFSFKGFKKASSDKDHTVLKHENGHEIKIAHKAISPKMRAQMNSLPKYEGGGIVQGVKDSFKQAFSTPTPAPPPAPTQDQKYEAIRTQNRANFGYAEGGAVYPVCKNPNCKSRGQSHPNCRCGSNYAEGGKVASTCSKSIPHNSGCEYFVDGGPVQPLPPPQPAAQDVQASMRKAFKFEDGGKVPPASESPVSPDQFQQDLDIMTSRGVRGTGATEEPVNRMDEPVGRQDEEAAALDLSDHSAKMVDAHSKLVDSHSKIVNALDRDAQASAASPQANTAIPGDMGPQAPAQQPGMAPYDSGPNQVPDPGAPKGSLLSQAKQDVNLANRAETAAAGNTQTSQAQNSQIYGKEASGMQDINQKYQQIGNDIHQRYQALADQVASGQIDPNHWWDSKSTGSKIFTAIGMILTGAGSQAGQSIDDAINRDIDAQKSNLNNKQTLLGKYMDMYKSLPEAEAAARLTMHAATEGLINQQAAKLGSQNAINAATINNVQRRKDLVGSAESLAHSQAMMGMYGSMGKPSQGGSEEQQFQQKLNNEAVLAPERYKIDEAKYLPGIGVAAKPVPDAVVDKLNASHDLANKLAQLENFSREHSNLKDVATPSVQQTGHALANDVINSYRTATHQGVFKEADQDFLEKGFPMDPTVLFAQYRTLPSYRELRKLTNDSINVYHKAYGVKPFNGAGQGGQNQDAMNWLKANPNDPRAAAVKQKLGM